MIGNIVEFETVNGVLRPKNAERSIYQPSEAVSFITKLVKRDYQTGVDILNKPFLEFNGNSPITEANENQKAFLMFPEEEFTNEDEKWRWNGVRPITRNKILSIAAHLTSRTLIPGVFAQNTEDEEDKQMAEVMRLIIEWNIRNSDYDITFLYGVIAGLVNPVAYLGVEFVEAMQKIRKLTKQGVKIEKAVDEVLSGLQLRNIPMDEVLITNPYEYYIQRQKAIGLRRYPEYSELEKIYGDHPNWIYVTPGVKTIYNEADSTFYDHRDEDLDTTAELFIYKNRGEDLEIPYINGIYFGNEDVEANPIKHRDQQGRPKYNIVKFGSEPVDEKQFFFYKSIASKMMQDYKLTNKIWRITVDTEVLNMKPPIGIAGEEKLESDIYYPGASVSMGKDTKYTPLNVGSAAGGYNLITVADQQIKESTQDPMRSGVASEGSQTAFEIERLEQNARIQLGLIGKMMVQMVKDVGNLMVDNIIHHQTVAEVSELMDGAKRLNFKKFLVRGDGEQGKTREIRFEDDMMGKEMTEDEMMDKQQELFEEEGGLEGKKRIYLVNPNKFRKIKYQIYMDVETLMPKNEALESALMLDAYNKAIQNPLIATNKDSLEAVTRDLLFGALRPTKGKEDKYMPKVNLNQMAAPTPQGQPQNPPISAQVANSQDSGALKDLMFSR